MRLEKLEGIKQGFTSLWESVADGWQRMRQSAASALTRFRPGEQANVPAKAEVDDDFYLPSHGWSMLGGDMFEDERRLVVRLEVPGMDKDEFDIELMDDALVVSGEKRFERERTEGRYRMLQCAYGSFRRVVPLPVQVLADHSKASYEQGVLKVELTKAKPSKPKTQTIKVN
jgi:HSP20 family protein